ncbi:MAG: amidohydrolase family protein, partial [Acidobacteria bacterium]|nr:amidohydrolase family protein [Acidobacteriota bacterium]
MGQQALVSTRVVTPEGVRPAAVLVESGKIQAVISPSEIPPDAAVEDFSRAAILPGLVDSHVHLNEPGRTAWEGFATGTCAAAAGGYTVCVDMPLNSLPPTTSVAALAAKRAAAANKCRIDWAAWGGVVADNEADLEPLAAAGVLGFKCFLVDSGVDEFSLVTEARLRSAIPHLVRSRLPLLVHAELPGPIEGAGQSLRG